MLSICFAYFFCNSFLLFTRLLQRINKCFTVMMTVVDTIPKEEIENCRKICEEEIGATYRVREYIAD